MYLQLKADIWFQGLGRSQKWQATTPSCPVFVCWPNAKECLWCTLSLADTRIAIPPRWCEATTDTVEFSGRTVESMRTMYHQRYLSHSFLLLLRFIFSISSLSKWLHWFFQTSLYPPGGFLIWLSHPMQKKNQLGEWLTNSIACGPYPTGHLF